MGSWAVVVARHHLHSPCFQRKIKSGEACRSETQGDRQFAGDLGRTAVRPSGQGPLCSEYLHSSLAFSLIDTGWEQGAEEGDFLSRESCHSRGESGQGRVGERLAVLHGRGCISHREESSRWSAHMASCIVSVNQAFGPPCHGPVERYCSVSWVHFHDSAPALHDIPETATVC